MSHAARVCSKRLAHDLLNHLNVIIGNCELLSERIAGGSEHPNDKKQPDHTCQLYLKRISEAAQLMASKVKNAQSKESSNPEALPEFFLPGTR
jgi:hypothetical protein